MSRVLTGTELKRLHRGWRRRSEARVGLLLDSVQNPFNVGSILRSAAAIGATQLWFVGGGALPDHPKVDKTALGSARFIRWSHHASLDEARSAVAAAGFAMVGVELTDTAAPLWDLDLTGDICLVVGHEDRGLSAAALLACDTIGYIPQAGRVASFNVAQATSVAFYEVRRQQWSAPA
jgi:tRNA (guanosine-2'-O-)-methyltransferase